jgi:hypothetical protein
LIIGMDFGRDVVQIRMPAGQPNERSSREALPSLLIQVPSRTIAGFDCVGHDTTASPTLYKDTVISIPAPTTPPPAAPVPAYDDSQIPYSLSLSMPASPSGFHLSQFRTASVHRDEAPAAEAKPTEVSSPRLLKQTRFHSQPILHASQLLNEAPRRADTTRDKRFDPFKTFSGRLERQLSNLRGRPLDPIDLESPDSKISEETDQVPATDRYFDALEGPELDTLKVSKTNSTVICQSVTTDGWRLKESFLYVMCRRRRSRCCRATRSGRSCCDSRSAPSVWFSA